MGSQPGPSRAALEPFATLDPAALASLPASTPLTVRSAALSAPSLLYLGTGGGKLLLFSLATPSSPEFLRLLPIGATRPVSAILPLPSVARVLVLADGMLLLADPLLARPVRRLGSLRGVAAVAASPPASSQSSCSLAVAVGKRLLVLDLALREADELEVQTREIAAGVEGISALAWVGEDSVFAGTASGYSLFSSSGGAGQRTDIFTLPESAGAPRIRPLSGGQEVMLLVDNVGVVVDQSGQPVGSSFVFNSRPDCIVEVFPYVVVAAESKVDVYRRRNGVHLQTVPIARRGTGVLTVASDGDGSGGEVVVVATAYKVFCYRKVSAVEQIKALLRIKSYTEAISLLEEFESDGEISNDMISFVHAQLGFLLFFDLRFEDAVNHFLLSETMQPAEIFPFIMRDPNRWSDLVPRKRYWGLHPPPKPLEEVIDDGLVTLQRALFLKKAGVDTVVDEDFLSNPPTRADLLELAIRNIIRYLCVSREKSLSPAEMEGVDTLLMYLYRALDLVDDMEKLASSQNSCVVDELESLLDNSGHLRTLAFLYGSKGMCSQAVAIWRILARNYSTGLWKDRPNLPGTDSQETSADKKSGEEIAAIEASKILQATSDQDLVLEHLGWVADIDQDLATAILTSEMREKQLSSEKVIAALDSEKVGIHQRYLQWLIEDQGCEDPHYHTSYALLLSKSAMEAFHMESNSGEKNDKEIDSDIQFIYSLRERLQLFLQASDLYDPEDVLDVIAESELWLEKAILYRKMGQENIVLQILALKLEDSEAAEQYCAEIGRDDAYIQLLDLYLDPKNGREPMFTAAVRLLHNHGKSLDPIQVLERLSSDMPLQLASDTILRMLRARVHHHRQGQIVHNLSRATNVDARLTRLEERSRHVQLTDESICDSCRARLGTKLFVMYPDDSVVCYRCYRNQGDSVSARGRNFRKDAIFKQSWLVSR
ncbi:vacuolar sorting protein 3 [Aegilops tauschii subsp. strangulata]|uniref:vacuolar sorting protein 3 n=1 Tax=Aegilops tauschii subsp. strangulata TaxID=200361 RepID=UPI00098A229A|nr:LOW QUALITY PROTEIN: vacuolar sorting protein 3 [Aegilops tauschii subsp. strangulata]